MSYKLLCTLLPVDIVYKVLEYSACYDTTEFHMYKYFSVLQISMMPRYVEIIIPPHERLIDRINELKRYSYMFLYNYFDDDTFSLNHNMIKTHKIIDIFPVNMRSYIRRRIIRCNGCLANATYCSGCYLIYNELHPRPDFY